MTNDSWRRVAFGLAAVLVLVLAFAAAMALSPGSAPPSTSPSSTATLVPPTPTLRGSPSLGPSSLPSVAPSASAPPSASAAPSASAPPASPSPSTSGLGSATVTVRGLKLDAGDDAAGRDRRLAFKTEDPAMVFVRVSALAPRSTTDACLLLNDVELFCTSGSTFQMSGHTSRPNGRWTVTLRGQGVATPGVDVRLEFPSDEPALTIDGAWFDGAARPDYNGIAVELVPRAGPLVSIGGTWDGSRDYRLTVQPPAGAGLTFEGTGSAVAQDVLLAGGELHRIELRNTGAGPDHIAFKATITWE